MVMERHAPRGSGTPIMPCFGLLIRLQTLRIVLGGTRNASNHCHTEMQGLVASSVPRQSLPHLQKAPQPWEIAGLSFVQSQRFPARLISSIKTGRLPGASFCLADPDW